MDYVPPVVGNSKLNAEAHSTRIQEIGLE